MRNLFTGGTQTMKCAELSLLGILCKRQAP